MAEIINTAPLPGQRRDIVSGILDDYAVYETIPLDEATYERALSEPNIHRMMAEQETPLFTAPLKLRGTMMSLFPSFRVTVSHGRFPTHEICPAPFRTS
jgi:hypothetical protein